MWVMWSEPLYDEKADIWYITVSHKNHLDRENPDEILSFETLEDLKNYDMNNHLKDFKWKEKAKELKDKREGKNNV